VWLTKVDPPFESAGVNEALKTPDATEETTDWLARQHYLSNRRDKYSKVHHKSKRLKIENGRIRKLSRFVSCTAKKPKQPQHAKGRIQMVTDK
jgi:hypothetical protein